MESEGERLLGRLAARRRRPASGREMDTADKSSTVVDKAAGQLMERSSGAERISLEAEPAAGGSAYRELETRANYQLFGVFLLFLFLSEMIR